MVPVVAESGPQAVALLQESVSRGAPFPVALFDLNLGGGDGFFLLEQIPPDIRSKSAIFATTDLGQRGDGARCRELSVRAYLTRPLSDDELLQAVILSQTERAEEGEQPLITRHLLRERAVPNA